MPIPLTLDIRTIIMPRSLSSGYVGECAHLSSYAKPQSNAVVKMRCQTKMPGIQKVSSMASDVYPCLKNQLVRLFFGSASTSFCKLPMIGRAGPSPPPPRRGFAILEPTPPPKAKDALALGEPSPRVEPAFAASRRSLTAVSCDSKLRCVNVCSVEADDRYIPMVCCC